MIRTSFLLPDTLHQRLSIVSRSERKNVSELVRELLDDSLTLREKKRNTHTYAVLKELDGLGGDEITDVSTTMNEHLYGDQGVWRGSGE